MVLKKLLKVVNWGTPVQIIDATGSVLLEANAGDIPVEATYATIAEAFVKSVGLLTDSNKPMVQIKIKCKEET